jgi:hypothetical protein
MPLLLVTPAGHHSSEEVADFHKIIDYPGVVVTIGALAHVQLGRAYVQSGDTAKA